MFLRIERPTTATLRPFAMATSAACWTRWMFDANEATMIRPVRSGMSWRNASPTSRSEPVIPGRSAFVESPSSRSTPRLPSAASAPTSVLRPSTGVWSSFQSPVCRTRPAAVSITTAVASGIECAIRISSMRNGPSSIGALPGSASVSAVTAARPCSSSFDFTRARVRRVPITSLTSTSRSTYGRPPTWSSWACVRTIARTGRPTRYEKSGSTRSTPKCSSRGNASPASTTMRSSPTSNTVMFLPTSPRPPSGMIRGCPSRFGVYGRLSTGKPQTGVSEGPPLRDPGRLVQPLAGECRVSVEVCEQVEQPAWRPHPDRPHHRPRSRSPLLRRARDRRARRRRPGLPRR